ncbi:MAG: sulfotransferase [Phycisphaeraceae bacterium]|nr:sulfotransferase [Phycisphaeraceae bacterium]
MAEIAQLIQDASQAHRAGDLAKAMTLYRQVLELDPQRAIVWSMLAQCFAQLNHFERAAETFHKAIALDPGQFLYRFFCAQSLRRLGRIDDAIEQLRESIRLRPDHLESHDQLCRLLAQAGRADELTAANAALQAALPQTQADAERLGDELARTRRSREALLCYRKAREIGPPSAGLLVKLGEALINARDLEAAWHAFREALELDPDVPGAAAHLVSLSERLNRLDDARWYAGAALDRDPENTDLNLALAKIDRREGTLPVARARLEKLIRSPRITSRWVYANVVNELAMTLDAMGLYQEAYERFAESQNVLAQRQEARRFPLAEYPAWLRHVRQSLSAEQVAGWKPPPQLDPANAPIFFVGFPRSGTTLLERMLAAHPRLIATDEAGLLPDLMNKAKAFIGDQVLFPQNLDHLDPDQITQLRRTYLADAQSHLGIEESSGKRIVDKLPLNIARLAAVRRIFPEAKVLVAIRDPRDVVLSCFFQVFGPNHAMVHFHTLESTVNLYTEVMSLWLRQREILGLDFMQTRYEDLIADPSEHARSVVRWLGESWDDAVLRYQESTTQAQINTPSYQAVASPIHGRARGRWRNYAWHLDPHLPKLEPFIREFGYEAR